MKEQPVVIKLGGSLASASLPDAGAGPQSAVAAPAGRLPTAVAEFASGAAGETQLARWLAVIAAASRQAVLVPGGGAFADTVRAEQRRLRYSDEAAHYMAILAMHQTGTVLIDMQPERLTAAATEAELRGALGRGEIPVWMALGMANADPALPRDWSITSDGLAAWLAVQLRIPEVWLVKSLSVAADANLATLAADGVVDPVFARIATDAGLGWRIFGPGEEAGLATALAAPSALPSA